MMHDIPNEFRPFLHTIHVVLVLRFASATLVGLVQNSMNVLILLTSLVCMNGDMLVIDFMGSLHDLLLLNLCPLLLFSVTDWFVSRQADP